MGSGISEYTGEHLAAIERTVHIAHKLQLHGTLLEHDLLTTQRLAQSAQTYHTHQLIRLPRNRTETVNHSLTEFSHLLFTLQMVEFAVEQHSLRTTRHVGIREIGLQISLHGTVIHEVITREQFSFIHLLLIQVVELLVLQLGDSLGENLLISLITQVFHESTLFRTQQITSTTNIQVLHSQIKTATQVAEGFQCFQTATGFRSKTCLSRSYQIAESLLVATPYPTSHLMQVAQSESVGIIHDDGIGIGNIDSVLYDGSRKEQIIVVIDESHDDLLQFLRLHLSMPDSYAAVWHQFLDEHFQLGQFGDTVADEEHLTVTAHLKIDGIGNHRLVEGDDLGLDRITVRRRCTHDTHIAGSHQRELQGSRNRSSTHGKGIHIHLQLAKLFLGRYTKLLLLINDQQSQVVPLY